MAKITGFTGRNGQTRWRVDFRDKWGQRKRRSYPNKKQAEEVEKVVEAEKLIGKVPGALATKWSGKNLSVEELVQLWEEHYLSRKEKQSAVESARWQLSGIRRRFAGVKCLRLSPRLILEYQTEALNKGLKQTSIRNAAQKLKGVLNWGVKHGYIPYNPVKDVSVEPGKTEPKRALTQDEIERLCHGLQEKARPTFCIMSFSESIVHSE